jgi:hypothetical protein
VKKVRIASLLLAFTITANVLGATKIVVLSPKKTIYNKAAEMLRDEIEKRTRIGLDIVSKMPGKDKAAIVIGTAKDLPRNVCKLPAGLEVPQKADGYALWVSGKRVKHDIEFAEKVKTLERLVFRTGPWRSDVRPLLVDREPGDTGLYLEDLPGADYKVPLSVYLIDDVRTKEG